MLASPQISVIIPAFNSAAYLPDTLESILAQDGPGFEIIVVDDGSTDSTRDVLLRYRSCIRYLYQENSGGPARPRNVAIEQARGKYVCVFDSDDLMLPKKLARSVAFLDAHRDLGLIFTDFVKFDESGVEPGTHMEAYSNFRRLPKERLSEEWFRIKSDVAFDSLFYGNYIGTSSVMAPLSVLRSVGPFDEVTTNGGLEDRDMWFRIARRFDIGYLNAVCHRYRVRPGSISRRGLVSARARIAVVRRHASDALSPATKRQACKVVSENYFDMGAHHWLEGNLRDARHCFLLSMLERPNGPAMRWLVLSLFGRRALFAWRTLRSLVVRAITGGRA